MAEECFECGKEREMKYRIDFPDGYSDFCSKKCAWDNLVRNRNELIYSLEDLHT